MSSLKIPGLCRCQKNHAAKADQHPDFADTLQRICFALGVSARNNLSGFWVHKRNLIREAETWLPLFPVLGAWRGRPWGNHGGSKIQDWRRPIKNCETWSGALLQHNARTQNCLSCCVVLWCVVFCCVVICCDSGVLCFGLFCHVGLCCVVLCYVVFFVVIFCCVVLWFFVLCRAVLFCGVLLMLSDLKLKQ